MCAANENLQAIDQLYEEMSILYAGICAVSNLMEHGPAAELLVTAVNAQFWRVKEKQDTVLSA